MRDVVATVTVDPTERRTADVVAFYDLTFNQCRPAEAIERFAGADYRQHNPEAGDGKQAFIDYFDRMAAEYPRKRVEFKRVLIDGDFVVLHCHQPGDLECAGIDIFRLGRDEAGLPPIGHYRSGSDRARGDSVGFDLAPRWEEQWVTRTGSRGLGGRTATWSSSTTAVGLRCCGDVGLMTSSRTSVRATTRN